MPVEQDGMSSTFDLWPSMRPALSEAQRELARKAAEPQPFCPGASNRDEDKVLRVLRAEGPQPSVAGIVDRTGMSASSVSKTISNLIDRGQVRRLSDIYGVSRILAAK